MFRFIQYIERQIVDAIEDAAFPVVNNMEGMGLCETLRKGRCKRQWRGAYRFSENLNVRTVLTAHPQFYPGAVLGIMWFDECNSNNYSTSSNCWLN
jgi:phosphoenolpyruvate carboxylase